MYCKYCGKEIGENDTFCPYCGKEQASSSQGGADRQAPNGQGAPGQYNGQNGQYGGQPPYPYPQPQYDSGSAGWGVLGFFIPLVGLILFLIWRDTKPRSSKKAGIGALIGGIVQIIFAILWVGVFLALFEEMNENYYMIPNIILQFNFV